MYVTGGERPGSPGKRDLDICHTAIRVIILLFVPCGVGCLLPNGEERQVAFRPEAGRCNLPPLALMGIMDCARVDTDRA